MRKKKILPFATTWRDLEGIMLNEIRQRYRPSSKSKKKISNKQPNLPPKRIRKRRTKSTVSRRKAIIKIREEINKTNKKNKRKYQ